MQCVKAPQTLSGLTVGLVYLQAPASQLYIAFQLSVLLTGVVEGSIRSTNRYWRVLDLCVKP